MCPSSMACTTQHISLIHTFIQQIFTEPLARERLCSRSRDTPVHKIEKNSAFVAHHSHGETDRKPDKSFHYVLGQVVTSAMEKKKFKTSNK